MTIAELHQIFLKSNSVCTDTRKLKTNDIFFALKGDNFNGNKFAKQALENGASLAVIDENEYQTEHTVLVSDVLKTLQELATYHRHYLNIPIVSLTGSNGKTTTKELINAVLSKTFKTTATLGNLNNHIGVPLTLLSMTKDTEIGIVEMGANHLNEIDFLCNIAQPNYGYITNFGKAHLEGFGGVEGVIKGKSELYRHLIANNKTIFVNANDAKQVELSKSGNCYTFGNKQSDIDISFVDANPFVKCSYNNLDINSNLIGDYNYNNISAAIAIGHYFKIADIDIKSAIENYTPTNNRSQIITKGNYTIILDAYNANPSSMEVALQNLNRQHSAHKIAILGDMFELGNDAKKEHQNIANLASKLNLDSIILVGSNFVGITNNYSNITCFESFEDLKNNFNLNIKHNTTLLIKGSRGMALERLLDVLD